jgi:DNA-binding transcriptional regulator GbsR (MarR family)
MTVTDPPAPPPGPDFDQAPDPSPVPAPDPAEWQREFMEQVGAVADVSGMPPSFVQVFAWLVVCDPPFQSVDQLSEVLGLSAGAISMATATLIRMGVVERFTQPGQRRLYYRFRAGGWERMLRSRLEATAHMRHVAERALADAPEPTNRLVEMQEVYAWFEDNMADLLDTAPWSSGN